ncbi:hypothetical protein EDC18_103294 [Natranaerovirga pectinivora]|uniref:Uncharacterized protein n=1 Tax=Natranaerovirga pectinivora TaxID=682400 RepID=A0A4R3MLL3_9FIRM|nr:hypothetical protein [Natranaerovirga pectinivora]TCT15586.1 hypothetical protein EDC18_103294 [Natranaerovirga pectinivora]
MTRKKKILLGVIAFFILIITYNFIPKSLTWIIYSNQANIKNIIVKDGSSGYEFTLDDDAKEQVLNYLYSVRYRRKIDLKASGGWSYRLELSSFFGKRTITLEGDDALRIGRKAFITLDAEAIKNLRDYLDEINEFIPF